MQKNILLNVFENHFGIRTIGSITVKDIVGILEDYKNKGQLRMAQIVRKVLSDVFKEAQQAGEVPAGFNPADATKKLRFVSRDND